jgi:branched-subunit amino acid ABC-type transport system permease component
MYLHQSSSPYHRHAFVAGPKEQMIGLRCPLVSQPAAVVSPQIPLTIGLSIGAQGLAQVLRGSGFRLVPNPINGAAIRFGGLTLQLGPAIAFIVALAVTIVMAWVLRATRFGKSARAVAESAETAEMLGIEVRRVYLISTSIAIGLVGLAAALLIPYQSTFRTWDRISSSWRSLPS